MSTGNGEVLSFEEERMKLRKLFGIKKSRRYPIKRDSPGSSLRARCFELFDRMKRPVEVAEELKEKAGTVKRYYHDWKKLGPNFERQYAYVKSLIVKTSPERDKNIALFAKLYGIGKAQLEDILCKPNGLRRLMTSKYHFPAHKDADYNRYMALDLALLISDHLQHGGKFVDVYFGLNRNMQENAQFRKEQDEEIDEYNKLMKIVHAVLEADMEKERQGRVTPDTLSEAEREVIIKFGEELENKANELMYWFNIGVLKSQGCTEEEARERIYQNFLTKGDLNGAKSLRALQDKVHPLKTGTNPQSINTSPPLLKLL
jgi:hypothetical protein